MKMKDCVQWKKVGWQIPPLVFTSGIYRSGNTPQMANTGKFNFSSLGRSPGRDIVLPPASVSALAAG